MFKRDVYFTNVLTDSLIEQQNTPENLIKLPIVGLKNSMAHVLLYVRVLLWSNSDFYCMIRFEKKIFFYSNINFFNYKNIIKLFLITAYQTTWLTKVN